MYRLTRKELLQMGIKVDVIKNVPDNKEAWDLLERELNSHGLHGLQLYQRTSENQGLRLVVVK